MVPEPTTGPCGLLLLHGAAESRLGGKRKAKRRFGGANSWIHALAEDLWVRLVHPLVKQVARSRVEAPYGDLQGWRLVPRLLFLSQHRQHLTGIHREKRHEKRQEDGEQGC